MLHMHLCQMSIHILTIYNQLQFQPLLDDLVRKLDVLFKICTSFHTCVLGFVWVASNIFHNHLLWLSRWWHEPAMACGIPSSHPLRKQLEESFAKAGLHRILAFQTCSWLFFAGCMGYSSILLTQENQRTFESHDHPLDLLKDDSWGLLVKKIFDKVDHGRLGYMTAACQQRCEF